MSLNISNLQGFNQPIEPLRTYHFARGLTLSFRGLIGTLMGGQSLALPCYVNPEGAIDGIASPTAYQSTISNVENLTTSKLIAASGSMVSTHIKDNGESELSVSKIELAHDRLLFSANKRFISDADLGEILLFELNQAETSCRFLLTSGGTNESIFHIAYELVLYWQEENKAGRVNPTKLSQLIASAPPLIKEAFFFLNTIELGESMRSSILRASYYLLRMTEIIWKVNLGQNIDIGKPLQPKELIIMNPNIDNIANEYTSAVLSAYSALDMLYEYFIFLIKLPFGDPDFPQRLHFPDSIPNSVFRCGGIPRPDDIDNTILPLAIPNLAGNNFRNLRMLRNDLVHNMAADSHRPMAYAGTGLPPVGGLGIQYVQYLSRDVEPNGQPLTHRWNRRFYEQQRDAQLALFDLIEQVWQCCFDTTKWLNNRLKCVAHDEGFV